MNQFGNRPPLIPGPPNFVDIRELHEASQEVQHQIVQKLDVLIELHQKQAELLERLIDVSTPRP